MPLLIENIRLQFDGGADMVMVFDTAAGELSPDAFSEVTAPDLSSMAKAFPGRLGYYAKALTPAHFAPPHSLAGDPWAGVGVDAQWNLAATLRHRPVNGFVQGNFDQTRLQLTGADLDREIDCFVAPVRALDPAARRGWICGLGHGVLPGTPEASVRRFVERVRAALSPARG